jgi:hypothetical protein
MPAIKLDVTDAAELAEMLQFLSGWLGRDPARLGPSLEEFVGHPPTASTSYVTTWSALCSCSTAATASPCSARHRTKPHASLGLSPVIGRP